MKKGFRIAIVSILLVFVTLGTMAAAEIDLSGMTAEELTALISKAGAELKRLEPLDDDSILYDKDGITISIDYLELKPKYDEISVHLIIINQSDLDMEGIYFPYIAINGWEVESHYNNEAKHRTNSKNGYIDIEDICKLSGISSYDDIESIEAYGTIHIADEYYKLHYLMTYTSEEGIKILKREEVED